MLAMPFDLQKILQCNMKEWHTSADIRHWFNKYYPSLYKGSLLTESSRRKLVCLAQRMIAGLAGNMRTSKSGCALGKIIWFLVFVQQD